MPTPAPAARAARSPLVAAALSFVFPGAGQLYLGRRTSAAFFAVPALIAVIWGILQLSGGLVYFAVSMLDVDYALTIMAVAAAFTAWRLAAIVQPFLVVRPRRIGARAGAVLALLLVVTLGMGDVVFSNAFAAYSCRRPRHRRRRRSHRRRLPRVARPAASSRSCRTSSPISHLRRRPSH